MKTLHRCAAGKPDQSQRRDFIILAAVAMAGLGLAAAAWPLIASMNPAADVRARRQRAQLTELMGTKHRFVEVDGAPILVFRRSVE